MIEPRRVRSLRHYVPNGAGWHLALQQTWDPLRLVPGSMPVVIVPGYGMNSFIFGYHPRGVSLEGALVAAGLEVWRVDLRGQGESRSIGGGEDFGLEDLAVADLTATFDAVLERSRGEASRVAVIGASLGGTLLFSHVTLVRDHKVGAMVGMGAPLRWVRVHPLVRLAFGSPALAGAIRFKGTRKLASLTLPHVLEHTPWLLSIYMTPQHVDTSALSELVRTVEDPNRHINRQIAHWVRNGDLELNGVNVARALRDVTVPFLGIVPNADGIVPPETARFAYDAVGSSDRTLLEVGTGEVRLAHADMFISDHAEERVFSPVRDWLLERVAPRATQAAAAEGRA